jgi:hypothetical protein
MTRKEMVLQLLQRGYELEVAFASSLSMEQRSEAGTWEEWSVRDSLAHNAAWRAHVASALAAVAAGEEPVGADDYQHQNQAIYEQNRLKSWAEVRQMAAEAHNALCDQVSALSDPDMNRTDILPWQTGRPLWQVVVGTGFSHPLVHVSDHQKRSGQIEEAAATVGELASAVAGLDDSADWQGRVKYNLACRHALLGEVPEAIAQLGEALELSPSLLEWSMQDPDLDVIREEPDCRGLFARHERLPE